MEGSEEHACGIYHTLYILSTVQLLHLVIPKFIFRVLESVYVIEYHYFQGKTSLMLSRLLRVLLEILYNIIPLSLRIWFYTFLVCYLIPLLRMHSGNLPLRMNKYYREHATCQTNSLSLKSCQMHMLPFMDLKCISNPQQHIAISWCADDPINTSKKTLGKR